MNDRPHPGDLLALEPEECVERLGRAPWMRIAFVMNEAPTILPVNHVVFEDAVYFRTAPGSKLGRAAQADRVAIEVDSGDPASRIGWSVVAHGTASIVHDRELEERLMALPFEPWALPEDAVFWIRIDIDTITGRTIVPKHGLPA